MTYRITEKMLEARVSMLNRITDQPETPWSKTADGPGSNIGNYHVSHAYGGVCLHQMVNNTHGAIRDVFSCGHIPKRELFDRICAMMDGIEAVTDKRRSFKAA